MQKRLYRFIVRLRNDWTLGQDPSVPEDEKPPEIEGYSTEVDVTSFIKSYKITANREALTSDATFSIINDGGLFTPSNFKSVYNRRTLSGIDTYVPLFGEGTEIQVYRITDESKLGNFATKDGWVPRYRGVIKSVQHGTSEGHDTLEVVAGDAMSLATKRTYVGSFSPIMRSSSMCPANSVFTLSTLSSAVTILRTVNASDVVDAPELKRSTSFPSSGEMSPYLLASCIFWDKEDTYYKNGQFISLPYFHNTTITGANPDEGVDPAGALISVGANTASSVFSLNGKGWFISSGTCTNVSPATQFFEHPQGPLQLNGTLRHEFYRAPLGIDSLFRMGYKITSAASVTVTVSKVPFDTANLTYGTPTVLISGSVTGPTNFDAATLGSSPEIIMLNDPGAGLPEWRVFELSIPGTLLPENLYLNDADFMGINNLAQNPVTNIARDSGGSDQTSLVRQTMAIPMIDEGDDDSGGGSGGGGPSLPPDPRTITLLRIEISSTGSMYIDCPRWEFDSVGVDANNNAVVIDNNILHYNTLERWTTEDGIIYKDPYPEHRILSKKNIRVVFRNMKAPYGAGTEKGYAPTHLTHRTLPSNISYERDLVEGSDYETLYDKGAIQLSSEVGRGEIFVAHSTYDIKKSPHMEAANLIKQFLVKGAGLPAAKVNLEPTGIILSKVTMDASTSTSILKAVKDIQEQLPGNYYIHADPDANVKGSFIQQHGSPRIFNPIRQLSIAPSGASLTAGKEYWYTVSALMPDGKETMASNLLSTVEYSNYYDAKHASIVDGFSCPALFIKPVPNQVGLVIRRAECYKSAEETNDNTGATPVEKWTFNSSNLISEQGHLLTDSTASFSFFSLVDLVKDLE